MNGCIFINEISCPCAKVRRGEEIFSTRDDMLLHTYKHFTANSNSVSMYVKPIKRACTRTGQRTYVVQEVE